MIRLPVFCKKHVKEFAVFVRQDFRKTREKYFHMSAFCKARRILAVFFASIRGFPGGKFDCETRRENERNGSIANTWNSHLFNIYDKRMRKPRLSETILLFKCLTSRGRPVSSFNYVRLAYIYIHMYV